MIEGQTGSLAIKLTIGISILLIIAAGICGVAYWSAMQERQTFTNSMASWKATYSQAYDQAAQSLANSKDMNGLLMTLDNLQASLKGWIPPQTPKFAGISLLNSEQSQSYATSVSTAASTRQSVNTTQALIAYGVKVSAAFASVNDPKINTIDELKTLSTNWTSAAASFAALTPPSRAQTLQQQFGQAIGEVTTTLTNLVRLYEQQDSRAFNAQFPDLEKSLVSFQHIDNKLISLAATQDAALQTQLLNMTTALSDY